jgi:hypothetical protein
MLAVGVDHLNETQHRPQRQIDANLFPNLASHRRFCTPEKFDFATGQAPMACLWRRATPNQEYAILA